MANERPDMRMTKTDKAHFNRIADQYWLPTKARTLLIWAYSKLTDKYKIEQKHNWLVHFRERNCHVHTLGTMLIALNPKMNEHITYLKVESHQLINGEYIDVLKVVTDEGETLVPLSSKVEVEEDDGSEVRAEKKRRKLNIG